MICQYRYYPEDTSRGETDPRIYTRMKVYNCNPCQLEPEHKKKEHCPQRKGRCLHRNETPVTPEQPGLAGLPVAPAAPVTPGLAALPVAPAAPVTPGLAAAVPSLIGLAGLPVVIDDFWWGDYYHRIKNLIDT